MKNKTLCIYQICPLDKTLEEYAVYLASNLKTVSDCLVIVSNGEVCEDDRKRLNWIADDLYIRDDAGLDAGAFADTLIHHITWEKLSEYEELILVNDSCYGPIYPLSEMTDCMNQRSELDFWAVTEQYPFIENKHWSTWSPYYIQPYYVVVRERMLHSNDFREFWETLKMPVNHTQAVYNYELRLTQFFIGRGYQCGAYIDSSKFRSTYEEYVPYIYYDVYNLAVEERCPFLKRKFFENPEYERLYSNVGDHVSKTISHIKEHTDYDERMIILDMLHAMNPEQIATALHLDYIITDRIDSCKGNTCEAAAKMGILIAIHDIASADYCLSRVEELAACSEVTVFTEDNQVKEYIRSRTPLCNVVEYCLTDYIHDIAKEQFVDKYDFLCIIDDEIYSNEKPYHMISQTYREMLWNNTLKSNVFIHHVLDKFETDPMLGALAVPSPYYSIFFERTPMLYSEESSKISGLLESMGITIPKSADMQPLTINNAFWIRTDSIRNAVIELADENNHITCGDMKHWGLLLPFIVRDSEHYCGILMDEESVPALTANYRYMLNEVTYRLHSEEKGIPEMKTMCRQNRSLRNFCYKNKGIYIYGAGDYGHECLDYVNINCVNFLGFVVSDGCKKTNSSVQEQIYEISELHLQNDEGVIIAVTMDMVPALEKELEKRKITNYISYLDV